MGVMFIDFPYLFDYQMRSNPFISSCDVSTVEMDNFDDFCRPCETSCHHQHLVSCRASWLTCCRKRPPLTSAILAGWDDQWCNSCHSMARCWRSPLDLKPLEIVADTTLKLVWSDCKLLDSRFWSSWKRSAKEFRSPTSKLYSRCPNWPIDVNWIWLVSLRRKCAVILLKKVADPRKWRKNLCESQLCDTGATRQNIIKQAALLIAYLLLRLHDALLLIFLWHLAPAAFFGSQSRLQESKKTRRIEEPPRWRCHAGVTCQHWHRCFRPRACCDPKPAGDPGNPWKPRHIWCVPQQARPKFISRWFPSYEVFLWPCEVTYWFVMFGLLAILWSFNFSFRQLHDRTTDTAAICCISSVESVRHACRWAHYVLSCRLSGFVQKRLALLCWERP